MVDGIHGHSHDDALHYSLYQLHLQLQTLWGAQDFNSKFYDKRFTIPNKLGTDKLKMVDRLRGIVEFRF